MLEEPYELIAHVRLCGEVDRVTGRLYPELDQLAERDFSIFDALGKFWSFFRSLAPF